nr:immunoglobulin light chain junction region [Homo sapiens]
CQQLNSYYTF